MPCGPRVRCTPGKASTIAVTASTRPSIAIVKIVGRAPFAIRNSAMGRLPMCEAASMAALWSPKPQSQLARARVGVSVTSAFTRARLPCAAPTTSRTRSRSWKGKEAADDGGPPNKEFENSRTRELDNETAGVSARNARRVRSGMRHTVPESGCRCKGRVTSAAYAVRSYFDASTGVH
jgi:hypothetical protein